MIVLLHQHLGIMLPLCDQLLTQAICLLEKSEKDNMEYIIGILKKSEHRGKYSSAGSVDCDEAAPRMTLSEYCVFAFQLKCYKQI